MAGVALGVVPVLITPVIGLLFDAGVGVQDQQLSYSGIEVVFGDTGDFGTPQRFVADEVPQGVVIVVEDEVEEVSRLGGCPHHHLGRLLPGLQPGPDPRIGPHQWAAFPRLGQLDVLGRIVPQFLLPNRIIQCGLCGGVNMPSRSGTVAAFAVVRCRAGFQQPPQYR
ncbi:hypothetical protein [Stackebrandtia albiflava]|uniref:hypothetical protein n=1 Tax=Stackebrandtia albiflava TaxID=406432 RepID=UPI0011BEB69C|nr:hypothetical protein [Stackebrandtia albiflava]